MFKVIKTKYYTRLSNQISFLCLFSPTPTPCGKSITPTTNQVSFGCGCEVCQLGTTSFSWKIEFSCSFKICFECLLPLFHVHWCHTEEYPACYIQRIFPPPCCSTEGSSLCPYHSPDMLVLTWSRPLLTHCFIGLLHLCFALPQKYQFMGFHQHETDTAQRLKSYHMDIKIRQSCDCVNSWVFF